jgi:tetratricopeptide (TPR) repeat protein
MTDAELVSYTVKYPKDTPALMELANRMEKQGMHGEAYNDFRLVTVADPTQVAAWLGMARTAIAQKNPTAARDAALKVAEVAANDATAMTTAGSVLLTIGDTEAAQRLLIQATTADPNFASAWDARAQVHLARKALAEAVTAGENATRLDPKMATYWLHLATARRLSADDKGAKEAIAEALRLAPDDGKILLEQGILLAQTGTTPEEKQRAETALKAAIQKGNSAEEQAEVLRRLGKLYIEERRYAEAEAILEQALRTIPSDTTTLYALSRALTLRGKVVEATQLQKRFAERTTLAREMSHLEMRLKREPNRAELYTRLGELYAKMGDNLRARAAWSKSLELQPEQPSLKKRLADLPDVPTPP